MYTPIYIYICILRIEANLVGQLLCLLWWNLAPSPPWSTSQWPQDTSPTALPMRVARVTSQPPPGPAEFGPLRRAAPDSEDTCVSTGAKFNRGLFFLIHESFIKHSLIIHTVNDSKIIHGFPTKCFFSAKISNIQQLTVASHVKRRYMIRNHLTRPPS